MSPSNWIQSVLGNGVMGSRKFFPPLLDFDFLLKNESDALSILQYVQGKQEEK